MSGWLDNAIVVYDLLAGQRHCCLRLVGWATPLLFTTCWLGNAIVVYNLLAGQRHCCLRLVGWATPLLFTTCYVIATVHSSKLA